MRHLLSLALWVGAPACVVIDQPVQVPCCIAGDGDRLTTTSVLDDDGLALSLTTAKGPTACALSENDGLELGYAGTQLFIRVDSDWPFSCPEGVYPLDGAGCGGGGVAEGCARLRTWDAQGQIVQELWSVSGAVIVEDRGFDRCHFEVEAVMPGGEVLEGKATTDALDMWGEHAVCSGG